MESYTIPRSGKPPLKFEGTLIAEASGKIANSKERNRWHELAIYRTRAGKLVAHVAYRTAWQGELDHDIADVFDNGDEVAEWMQDFDPTEKVGGYPPQPAYADKQARLLADIETAYDWLVTGLFKEADITEEIA